MHPFAAPAGPPISEHALRVLEFDAIRQKLVEQASNSLGQERAWDLAPATDEKKVKRLQSETREAVHLLNSGGIPLGGIHDIRPAIRAAAFEGMLEPTTLLGIRDTAAAARKLKRFLLQKETLTSLTELARRMGEFSHLEEDIADAISDNAEVRDDASPALARLRKEMRQIRARMTERLHSILRNPGYRDMLQDPVITTRDGRFCLPVKSEYRTQFGGLVHDQSSSGATLFMEPTAVVELGNEFRQVEIKERQEVERVLRALTALVGNHSEALTETVETLGELDFIFARGKLALAMDATEPQINDRGFIGLRRARHPLLTGHVVPIDVELGREHTVIVITGPNTGGKTVTLKTVGLHVLMAQCGLQIPAHEGSTLSVFRGVYADIGDEQSIQQSLSTFSGHITNIANILRGVEITGQRSLVLLDEAGAGTDPTEGAALAKAILHHLLVRGARTIASTHYGELKEFAYSTDGVENASVEFDIETLRPTYRLLIGIPGSSNAFSIAARLGLPEPITQAAREMIGTDRAVLSDVIQRLTEDQRATEHDLRRASQAARDVEQQREQYERDLRQLRADRTDTLARARAEAEEILRKARLEMERVRGEVKRLEKQAKTAAAEPGNVQGLEKVRERLQKATDRLERRTERVVPEKPPQPEPEPAPAEEAIKTDTTPVGVGDLVWVAGLNQRGTILSITDGKAQVQIGSMRMTLPLDGLQRIVGNRAPAAVKPSAATGPISASRAAGSGTDMRMRARANISPEVHLLGLRSEEALTRLDEYVDDACLAGFSPIRIVHGKGTGALKRVVWEYLQGHPHISAYRHPSEEEGGNGVTIAELRE